MVKRVESSKVVSSLPATLTPDTHYYVRVGNGFDHYLSNSDGSQAHKTNHGYCLQQSGRFYLYTDHRWVTNGDDNYGTAYYQFNESGTTAANPVIEWEHKGHYVKKGKRIKKLTILGKCNSAEVSDLEIYAVFKHPNPATRWETGYDNDAEDTVIDLHRDNWMNPAVGTAFGGASNDDHRREIDIDFVTPEDGYLSIYVKPSGNAAQRYFMCVINWDIENE